MSNHVNPNMSNREVADFTLVDFKTKQPWLNVDFANVTTTEMAATPRACKGRPRRSAARALRWRAHLHHEG